jgi:hypothetical protein
MFQALRANTPQPFNEFTNNENIGRKPVKWWCFDLCSPSLIFTNQSSFRRYAPTHHNPLTIATECKKHWKPR